MPISKYIKVCVRVYVGMSGFDTCSKRIDNLCELSNNIRISDLHLDFAKVHTCIHHLTELLLTYVCIYVGMYTFVPVRMYMLRRDFIYVYNINLNITSNIICMRIIVIYIVFFPFLLSYWYLVQIKIDFLATFSF